MDRQAPVALSDEIDLYVRTYYSLLRSSGEVRVRAFEETHAYSTSSLHTGALSPIPDTSAFAYAAARLPDSMPDTRLVVLGQSHELFEAAGYDVATWRIVRTRGRRRPLRYDEKGTLAVFIASESDIDDLVPIVTAYQIEWNKMHERLRGFGPLADAATPLPTHAQVREALGLDEDTFSKLVNGFGASRFDHGVRALITGPIDLKLQMLAPSYSQYQRAAQRWWSAIEPAYLRAQQPRRGPVYFVSSNTHAIANLVGGYARAHADAICDWAKKSDPEGLGGAVDAAEKSGDDAQLSALLYYLLRAYIHAAPETRMREVREFEGGMGLVHLTEPGHVYVDAQLIQLNKIKPERLDPRLRVPGIERLAESDAFLLNIDYPLGMAAYHLLSRVGQGVGELRGVYVMGKAATLNGRVGDVAVSGVVFDEHSRNTYLLKNAFTAGDVRPYLTDGNVFDNQSALTVRSAFLQNKQYMSTFYRDGYTVLEMEAGPFLSAIYELVNPAPCPENEIVHLSAQTQFDIGLLHYASDTPYSRRQSLLSKSLSYFGVDSTYACAIAIVRRILEQEVARAASRARGSIRPGP